VPGVSRHGAALSALRARGFAREDAHAISRDASRPVLAGAAALKGWRVARRLAAASAAERRADALPLLAAAAGSALSTRLAAHALAGRGVRAPLWPFAAYRVALALTVLAAQPSRT
jgi:undecaprenyl-diphosphatase